MINNHCFQLLTNKIVVIQIKKIKSSLYSRYNAQACNEWWGPSTRLSVWATQLRLNIATVASRWRHRIVNFLNHNYNLVFFLRTQIKHYAQLLTASPKIQATLTANSSPSRHMVVTAFSSKSCRPMDNATRTDRQHD